MLGIASIFKPALGLIKTVVEGKQRVKEAETEAKVRRMAHDDNWETESMKASAESWKDELWTILFVAIIAACFIPWTQPYVDKGFLALKGTPEWFQWAVGASISASFGIKATNIFKKKN